MTSIKKQSTSILFLILCIVVSSMGNAQETETFRKGFMFEIGLGGGVISVEDSKGVQTFDKSQGAISFPELKLGYFLNENLALTVSMPGMIYEFNNNDRHFGGILPSIQYWVKDRWWIHGGIGLAIDSPTLYDIKDQNDKWNYGCAVMASTGYEVYKKKNFAVNIQSKIVLGRVFLNNNINRDFATFNIGLGFNCL
ncbi:hypothetical protein [uncultured Kordia sp.]|uniref:hypothetical protein n=1 Tax=uncultured Kordia sp. TaxID=507699 RepID=UPI00260A732B|nr:hypothetical protein [uncultured Kordia sp.]